MITVGREAHVWWLVVALKAACRNPTANQLDKTAAFQLEDRIDEEGQDGGMEGEEKRRGREGRKKVRERRE